MQSQCNKCGNFSWQQQLESPHEAQPQLESLELEHSQPWSLQEAQPQLADELHEGAALLLVSPDEVALLLVTSDPAADAESVGEAALGTVVTADWAAP